MRYLEEKKSTVSLLVENQFPSFVKENNSKFLKFLEAYYESLENKYQPLDIVSNLIDYYNIGYYKNHQLIESTTLNENLLKDSSTITVSSTIGFPTTNGYIKINDEVIFYKEKTSTQFLDCVRGTKALILQNVPKSEVVLETSVAEEHASGSTVVNIAYSYTSEFFRRIKSEVAPLIPEKITSDLDISSFIKKIKSFYSSKGSLNGHRILFKILFNDRRYKLILKPRGSGAEIKVNNYFKSVPKTPPPTIINGGSGYDNRVDTTTGEFLNSPVIDIIGSGTGEVNSSGLRPNKTAVVVVNGIDSSGSITSLEVIDGGDGYIGPITAKVRPRSFFQDEIVYNSSGTGFARVEYWDSFTNELILYDVNGYFKADDEIICDGKEKARGFVTRIFVGTTSIKDGTEIIPEVQQIEFPKDYTFKTSSSQYNERNILKLRLISGELPQKDSGIAYTLKQDPDTIFGVPGVEIEIDNITRLSDNLTEYEISTNSDINNIYLPPTTEAVLDLVNIPVNYTTYGFNITVDDASGFPITNGLLYVNGNIIEYKTRTHNQFLDCAYNGSEIFNINVGEKIISWGRKKYDVEWTTNKTINEGQFIVYGENLYKSINSGTTSSLQQNAPTHTEGVEQDGSYGDGDLNPVQWKYIGSNIFKYYFYSPQLPDVKFELISSAGDIFVVDGGSLHIKEQYEFADLETPNTQFYNFTTSEISDRLAALLSSNFNRSYNSVTNPLLPSYGSVVGFNTQYDYQDYIYVPTTTIPKWWDKIVDLNSTLSNSDVKKISFTNQKLLCRWNKSGLIYETQAIGVKEPTIKSIGLNIDAIQINSVRGNTIRYGKINTFSISSGGDYVIPISSGGLDVDTTRFPKLYLDNGNTSYNTSKDFVFSGRISKINFTKLYELFGSDNFTGYSSKPSIEIINRNPLKVLETSKLNIDTIDKIITVVYSNTELEKILQTAEKVRYIGVFSSSNKLVKGLIPSLTEEDEYYVRQQSISTGSSDTTVTYSIHKNETDCLLNINSLSLSYLTYSSSFTIKFESSNLNPIYFEPADIQISYNQSTGSIDNFIILNPGNGYIEAPYIKISGGGKLDQSYIYLPYTVSGEQTIDFRGSLISKNNFYKQNYYETSNTVVSTSFNNSPTVTVDAGSKAEASVYVSSGKVASIILVSSGRNYYTRPIVNVIGNGKNAVVEAKIDTSGKIIGFDIINPGEGYTLPATLEILPAGSGASITTILTEWTFNNVHRMQYLDRIDNYGGYVYDEDDSSTEKTIKNDLQFKQIDPKQNLPYSLDYKQYLILKPSDKLLADYTRNQRAGFLKYLYPSRDLETNPLTDAEALSSEVHSPSIGISYDGIPIYGKRGYSTRWNASSSVTELKSRYRLKYSTTPTTNSVEIVVGSTSYYVNREGGPPVNKYPIGSFIEDYEYVPGNDDSLDEHNGRFCVTPEFPTGRYCYFATTSSYDSVTNSIISNSGVSFGGYPYFIGPTYSSIPDKYSANGCRTSDKIPKGFTRVFEKSIPSFEVPDYFYFPGLPSNPRYPKEDTRTGKLVTRSSSLSPGTIDSVIIEEKGSDYSVGDTLKIDNRLTFGSGFSALVSKVTGKSISKVLYDTLSTEVTIQTTEYHNLSVGDYVYFDYNLQSSDQIIDVNLHGLDPISYPVSNKIQPSIDLSLSKVSTNVDLFKNKKFYTISLNSKFVYNFILPSTNYVFTYDVEKVNEYFILPRTNSSTTIIIDAKTLPSTIYLHVSDFIYEITTSKEYRNEYKIVGINELQNTFTIDPKINTKNYEILNIKYVTKSKSAKGGIEEVIISNSGSNYIRLPEIVGVESSTGTGAILQSNSSTIGKIRNISYLTSGGGFTSNPNVNYYLNLPSTAKVINNFEIYDVEIVNGGSDYNDVLAVKVNGQYNLAKIRVIAQLGIITSVEIQDGGTNFSSTPKIEIVSSTGSGAELRAKIRRKKLSPGNEFYSEADQNSLFPVKFTGTVVNFEDYSSTIEFDEYTGQFKENQLIYTSDGKPYGRLVSIRRPKAYAKSSPYTKLPNTRRDNLGNTSDFLQKLTDSNVYQDWSYIISSSRDTIEWRDSVLSNTHPSGHRLFGKKIIERRKSFFGVPDQIFKSSVIFTTSLKNNLPLNVKLSSCNEQTIVVRNTTNFSVGEYIYGSDSGAVARILQITETSIKIDIKNNINFIVGELAIKVSANFALGINSFTEKYITFSGGILQEPEYSYEISPFDTENNLPDIFVPKFIPLEDDDIILHKLTTNFDYLDSKILTKETNSFKLTNDSLSYDITESNKDQFIISIGGSVQNPSNFTVSSNTVFLSQNVKYDNTRLFAIRHTKLKKLVFTGNSVGTTYTLNYTPSDNCKIIVFSDSVSQSYLINNWQLSGNTITFDESVQKNNIFGWYIDENVECEQVDISTLNDYKIIGTRPCILHKFSKNINSSAVKNPSSLYEIKKEVLDGTVLASTDDVTVYGFDTKFTYTSPSKSSSYVEVIDPITFNGTSKQFTMKTFDNLNYTPKNGKKSILVSINNEILDPDLYSVSGSNITFTTAYPSGTKCSILDFVSGYKSNYTNINSEILDRLNVSQNGTRTTFNLSDRGVPKYVNNVGDIFVIKDGELKIPTNSYVDYRNTTLVSHTINDNKITFVNAPTQSEEYKLAFFNRQLLPEPSKNVVLDTFRCFDGIRTSFPITVDGILFAPISVNHVYIIRNGVFQKPGIDYTLSGGHNLVFTTAPQDFEFIFGFYSYDGLNQNIILNIANYVDGVKKDFALTVNYVSTTVISNSNLMVFRNGVYQTPTVDYTVLNKNSGPYIRFTVAPQTSDEIYIINLKDSQFNALTFTQSSSNTITLTSSQVDDDMFLVFVNGILQVGNSYTTSYISGTYTLTFTNNINLSTDNVRIYAFNTGGGNRRELDSILVSNTSTLSYPLTYNSSPVSNLNSESDLIVTIEGVVQEPGISYTISGSTITFNTTILYQTGITINIFQVGDVTMTNPNEYVDYINDNYTKTTQTVNGVSVLPNRYKLMDNFLSFNPPSADDLYVIRSGVVQNPSEDFIVGPGFIEFSTNITESDDIFIMYTHGSEELTIIGDSTISSSVHRYTTSSTISPSDYNNIVLFADGSPRFYYKNDFTISGSNIDLTHTTGITPTQVFIMKYVNVTVFDDFEDCPNSSRTRFKLLYNNQNLISSNIVNDADILISINGVVQHPGSQYTLTANRTFVDFTTAPDYGDEIFMVRMLGNAVRNLTATGTTKQYTLNLPETTEKESIVVFSNNTWKFAELGDFTWNNDSTITLSSAHTTGQLFAIKFFGIFRLLDQINTPYNSVNKKFNLFVGEQNFVPIGTAENNDVPDETGIFVTKNGKVLDPKVDYTLTGDNKSQIQFTTAPQSTDTISVRSFGSFKKINSITSGLSGKTFDLKLTSTTAYYPNALISRPRQLENQILVMVNGNIQSPIDDYYIDNNKLIFNSNIPSGTTKITIVDFMGTTDDIKVNNRFYQVNKGDEITLPGESQPRIVAEVLSPTVLKTNTYSGKSPSGFSGTVTYSSGKVTDIDITSGGTGYDNPVVLITKGSGTGARAIVGIDYYQGNVIKDDTVNLYYPGYNIYKSQEVVATGYAYTYRNQQLNKSQIRKATKLTSNINSTTETISLKNTENMLSNPPSVSAIAKTGFGSGATFRAYVSDGKIRKVDIITPGIGYDDRSTEIQVTGGGGTGCVLEPVLDAFGSFTSVIVRNGGSGYDTFKVIVYDPSDTTVDAEFIEYTYVTQTQILGCTRGTGAESYSADTMVYFDSYL